MTADVFLSLLLYAFVCSVTPGPNNFMLLASGVNFGFRRTIPHMLGIGAGFLALLLAVGFGLGALLVAYPPIHTALKIVGAAYLLYLAFKIAMSRSIGGANGTEARPMTFLQAAGFQWVNPKAWMIGLTGMALFTTPQAPWLSALLVALAFAAVNLPSVSVWAAFGTAMRGFLSDPVRLKWFNIAMGVLLAVSVIPMLA